MSSTHINKHIYPYLFAESVVDAFIDKYARVLLFVCKKLWISPKDHRKALIGMFMRENPRWNVTRDLYKSIEVMDLYDYLSDMTREDFIKYLTCVKTEVEDSLIDTETLRKQS